MCATCQHREPHWLINGKLASCDAHLPGLLRRTAKTPATVEALPVVPQPAFAPLRTVWD